MSTAKQKAVLIVAAGQLSNGLLPGEKADEKRLEDRLLLGEKAVKKRLEELDYNVDVKEAPAAGLDVRDTTLMVVSSSVKDSAFGDNLRDLVVPIIASSKELYVSLGMCGRAEAGEEREQSAIEIIAPPRPGHPMTADLKGIVKISSESMDLSWARNLHSKSQPIAALPESSRSLTLLDRAWHSIAGFAKQVIPADGTAEVVAPEPAVAAEAAVVAPEPVVAAQAAVVAPKAKAVADEAAIVGADAPIVPPEPAVAAEAAVVAEKASVVAAEAEVAAPKAGAVSGEASVTVPEAPGVAAEAPLGVPASDVTAEKPAGKPAEKPARKIVLFGCRVATPMFVPDSQEAKDFPAKRVAFPLDHRKEPTKDVMLLFEKAVNWAVGDINVRQFAEVFREEWKEIYQRRLNAYAPTPENNETGFDGMHAPENLVGLAFSGGGIRSATFCLGVLQALHELNLLRFFDYLSTVSGGGYLGGWWSAWLSRPKVDDSHDIFPNREKIEPERLDHYRWRSKSTRVAEGSLSAGHDPIHHLRLFANYLTPRTGSLSADTWRAIAVLSRNLLLTWVMLLPLLLGFVIAAQSLFLLYPNARFLHTHWDELAGTVQQREKEASSISDQSQLQKFNQDTETMLEQHRSKYRGILRQRALFIVALLLPIIGWILMMFLAYMRSNAAIPLPVKLFDRFFSKDRKLEWKLEAGALAHILGAIGVAAIASLVLLLAWPPQGPTFSEWLWPSLGWLDPRSSWWARGLIAWFIVGTVLMFFTMPWRRLEEHAGDENTERELRQKTEKELRQGVWRNRISSMHAKLLVTLFLFAVLLVFAAYGHEMFDYLWRDPEPRKQLLGYVAKIGGWGAFAGAIFGTIFSALKSAPTGGHDSGDVAESPAWHKAIFTLTPLLVMFTLMVMAAWLVHKILNRLATSPDYPWPLIGIILVGIVLALFFALFEVRWRTRWLYLPLAIVSLIIIGTAFLWHRQHFLPGHGILLFVASIVGSALVLRLTLKGDRWSAGWRRLEARLLNKQPGQEEKKPGEEEKKPGEKIEKGEDTQAGARWFARLVLVALTLLPVGIWWFASSHLSPTVDNRTALTLAGLAGMSLCLIYIGMEAFCSKGDNRSALILLTSVYLVSLLLMLLSFHSPAGTRLAYVSLGFFATTLTWVIALGWMADPNAISMHGFYQGRLVRAYLGASNPRRFEKLYEITETVVGDDLLLSDMKNCDRGAPYHLLNTTLNLTGGRDLATAQRSSAMFVLSKLYCGSFRTGFQRSKKYANGSLTLGMAVATSGAAVSPGMGAGKTTASQAMLMTLLNLRLGFWAPTPGGEQWESRQARLWPFHTMREFLSQTNDLSSYCYLTDGGHFDNLGLYSLVERGCRYIVAVDAVADPRPCFSDLGNSIRRCRIDFDTDIDLDITSFVKSKDHSFAKQHYVVGQILYSEDHVKKLGWKNISEAARTGVIVYIKTSLLKNEKDLRADVRQYEIENSDFPQQSTVNQWFDEAQFESYRKLGKHSGLSVFRNVATDPRKVKRAELKKKAGTLSKYEQTLLEQLEAEEKLVAAVTGDTVGPLSPNLIKTFFDITKRP